MALRHRPVRWLPQGIHRALVGGPAELAARSAGAARLLPIALRTGAGRAPTAWVQSWAPHPSEQAAARQTIALAMPLPPVQDAVEAIPYDPPAGGFGPWMRRARRADRGLRVRWERWRLQDLAAAPVPIAATGVARWLAAHPPPAGEAWMDGLEVAVRMVHLLQCLARVAATAPEAWGCPPWASALAVVRASADLLRRAPVPAPPAMNHRLGEAAALWVFTAALPHLPEAPRTRARAARDLSREVGRQFDPEGAFTREMSTGYQRWDLGWLGLVAAVATRSGVPPPEGVLDTFDRGCRTLSRLGDPTGSILPMGDDDGSSVGPPLPLPLRPSWTPGRVPGAEVLWVGEPGGRVRAALLAGPTGAPGLGAHGHSDALSALLWVEGVPVIVDPGTGTYRPGDPLHRALRGAAAHAGVVVDGVDPADPAGPFLWGRRVVPRVVSGLAQEAAARLDPYPGLVRPLAWTRTLRWLPSLLEARVDDLLEGGGDHRATWTWPLAPGAGLTRDGDAVVLRCGSACVRFQAADLDTGQPLRPEVGTAFVSKAFERAVEAPVLTVRSRFTGSRALSTRFRLV